MERKNTISFVENIDRELKEYQLLKLIKREKTEGRKVSQKEI